jgi:tetratricopeptide (TPR) repeat protein
MKAIALVLLLTATAAADTAVEKARNHFKQGKAFQDAGAFERAAEEYKIAYEADPRPEMLFNIAQAYRLAKLKEQALDYFKQYLDKQPNGAGSDEARKHVVTLTQEIDQEKAAAKEPVTVLPPDGPMERVSIEDHGKGLRYTGLAIGAAGVIAVGLGVKFAFDARGAADDITNHEGPWTKSEESRFDEGERANRNMKITYAIGGALLAGGAVLYYFGNRSREVRVTTMVTPDGAAAGVQGSF